MCSYCAPLSTHTSERPASHTNRTCVRTLLHCHLASAEPQSWRVSLCHPEQEDLCSDLTVTPLFLRNFGTGVLSATA